MKTCKNIALDYAEKVWNDKDVGVIDALTERNILIHSLLGDFQGNHRLKEVVNAWLKGFPDLTVKNTLIIAENDLVSIQWAAQGTHQGVFKDIQPTGNHVSYSGVTIYRIKDDKIVEYWAYLDMQHLLNQLT